MIGTGVEELFSITLCLMLFKAYLVMSVSLVMMVAVLIFQFNLVVDFEGGGHFYEDRSKESHSTFFCCRYALKRGSAPSFGQRGIEITVVFVLLWSVFEMAKGGGEGLRGEELMDKFKRATINVFREQQQLLHCLFGL